MVDKPEVTPRWTARRLSISVKTVWRWCREERIQVRQDAAGRYWLSREKVEAIAADPAEWRREMRDL